LTKITTMQRKKILYITHIKATFIEKDTAFLAERYDLIPFDFHLHNNRDILALFVKQLIFLAKNIGACDLVFCQFAGYHSALPALLAKLFKKPCLVVVAGTDAYSYPSINYGNFRKKMLGWFTAKTFQWSTNIVPVDESLIETTNAYYEVDGTKQGILTFCSHIKAKFSTIYYGYDPAIFVKLPNKKVPKSFVTIGKSVDTLSVFYRKGIDLILELAIRFPDCQFTIIGMKDKNDMPSAPANVEYIAYLESKALVKLLAEKQYYLQLSIAEGFPNALCEGMLSACVPIGSDVAAIPNIIGATGFILKKKNIEQLENIVLQALNSDTEKLGSMARDRILQNFSLALRKENFYVLIDSLN